ncbi:MAG: regulator, partial [Bacteroidota bacterium]
MLYFIVVITFFPYQGRAQIKTMGLPNIQNHPKSQYKAGTQNWDIIQDDNGFIYFANNQGVLRFDGMHWDLIEVSESSPVRAVCIDQQNNIYVGLFNDFGILQPNDAGKLVFKS